MKKFSGILDQTLKWEQPSALKMNYELHAGEETAGTLEFRSFLGSFATAENADGCWTFKRVGFWQTRVTIWECGTETEIATFKNNTWSGGGTLDFGNGESLRATTNFWQTRLEFQNEAGEVLIRFKQGGVIHLSAEVEILPSAARLPELPLLVMLGWYLIVTMNRDTASITAATTSSST